MTEQEMRELDAWLAERIIGTRLHRGDRVPLPTDVPVMIKCKEDESEGTVIAPALIAPPRFCTEPTAFSEIKREIERRGWSWYASWSPRHENQQHYFSIDSGAPDRKSYSYSIIHTEMAETEELAGCLAFKAAVEAVNDG